MKTFLKLIYCSFILLFFVVSAGVAHAGKARYTFKVASLAPEGSVWTQRFRDFASEVTEKSGGEIGFKIYAGGVMVMTGPCTVKCVLDR
jgi:TRAP-type C4-dicarboxylate transport system substrate-binding protein